MSDKRTRIIIAEFHQETNSFNPVVWTREKFLQDTLLEGETMLEKYRAAPGSMVCGILEALEQGGAQVIPACAMRASSGGRVDHRVVLEFINSLLVSLERSGPVDGFVLSLHGATQSTEADDVCGLIVRRLREAAGREAVIAVGCDLHANVTREWAEAADYICGFQTYPHTDQFQTGARAARLALRRLQGGTRIFVAHTVLPMIVPAAGYTTEEGPFAVLVQEAQALVEEGELTDFSVFQMQPWLDVNPAGSSVIAMADTPQKAEKYAALLARRLFELRGQFWPRLTPVDEILERAKQSPPGRPTVLVDFADSVGAGALGDSVFVLLRLLESGSLLRAAMLVNDREAVARAREVGEGGAAVFSLGAGLTPGMTGPVRISAKVVAVGDGTFAQSGRAGTGLRRNLGNTAVLQAGNVDILVCEHLCGAGDIQIYRQFGIEPEQYQLVAVKANTSFRDSYGEIASEILLADTPGLATADLLSLPYGRLPREFYPFSSLETYTVHPAKVFER